MKRLSLTQKILFLLLQIVLQPQRKECQAAWSYHRYRGYIPGETLMLWTISCTLSWVCIKFEVGFFAQKLRAITERFHWRNQNKVQVLISSTCICMHAYMQTDNKARQALWTSLFVPRYDTLTEKRKAHAMDCWSKHWPKETRFFENLGKKVRRSNDSDMQNETWGKSMMLVERNWTGNSVVLVSYENT